MEHSEFCHIWSTQELIASYIHVVNSFYILSSFFQTSAAVPCSCEVISGHCLQRPSRLCHQYPQLCQVLQVNEVCHWTDFFIRKIFPQEKLDPAHIPLKWPFMGERENSTRLLFVSGIPGNKSYTLITPITKSSYETPNGSMYASPIISRG